MAAAVTKLKEQGWHFSEDGLKKLTDNGQLTEYKELLKTALNTDIKELCGGAFPFELNKGGKVDSIAGGVVVQITKISNISAPKSNQDSKAVPRLLKLELTDGQITFPGLEYESIPAMSLVTPPGTKILLKNGPIKISNGFFLLGASYIEILGGRVEHLIEKWEAYRITTRYSKSVVKPNTGAPSWSLFGKNLENMPEDKSFKSLTPEQEKESAEFNLLRNNAIEQAIKLQKQNQKVFGGGNVRIIDFNIQKIVDKGYTIDQAKYSLKMSRNNLERAFASLKKQNNRNSEVTTMSGRPGGQNGMTRPFKDDRFSKRLGKGVEIVPDSKPSGKLSLFDFLEDKLPPADTHQSTPPPSQTQTLSASSSSTNYQKRYDNSKPSHYNSSSSQQVNKYNPHKSSSTSHSSNNNSQHTAAGTASSSTSAAAAAAAAAAKAKEISDRSKFENNISASFRQKKEDHPLPSYSPNYPGGNNNSSSNNNYQRHDNRSNSYDQYSASSRRPNFSINTKPVGRGGGYAGNSSLHRNQNNGNNTSSNNSNQSNSKYQSDVRRSERSERPERSDKNYQGTSQTHPPQRNHSSMERNQSSKNYGLERGGTNSKPSHGTSQQQQRPVSYPSHGSGNQHPKATSSPPLNYNTNVTTIIEKTAKINLNLAEQTSTPPPQQQQLVSNSAAQSQQTVAVTQPANIQNNNFAKVFPQISNGGGYGYNPYKIVGFQNKESNEFAMNILKHEQNFEFIQSHPPPQQSQPPPPQSQPPPPKQTTAVQLPQKQATSLPPPKQQPQQQYHRPQNQQQHHQQQQQHHHPQQQTHTPHVSSVVVAPNQPSVTQTFWKVGDRCLAKYWEDRRFYVADITGISERTFVVHFIEYGNFEEVVKTDILPLNEQFFTNNIMKSQNMHQHQQHRQNHDQQQQQQHQNQNHPGSGGGGRYREERRMYVPPAQRNK